MDAMFIDGCYDFFFFDGLENKKAQQKQGSKNSCCWAWSYMEQRLLGRELEKVKLYAFVSYVLNFVKKLYVLQLVRHKAKLFASIIQRIEHH